jgi:uncharacterized protein (UPF0332 family)
MKDESKLLAAKAKESLDVARELAEGKHYDFAASRAYYGMFYMAEAALFERGQAFSSHRAFLAGFYREFVDTGALDRGHHQSLVRGFELRQAGDYGTFASVSEGQCADLLERAKRFVDAVQSLLEGETK